MSARKQEIIAASREIVAHATKKCSSCKVAQPRTEDCYFRNKATKDGFDNYCKSCRNDASRRQYHIERNPQYYELAKDKRQAFLDRLMQSYDREHLRVIQLRTRERYHAFTTALKLCIKQARDSNDTVRAKILARLYKSLVDSSPWQIEIQFPEEWRAMSRWLRRTDGMSLYQWLRTHYEVKYPPKQEGDDEETGEG